ncbi:hypothetical protein Tco_0757990 [Tanacetum coccineum]
MQADKQQQRDPNRDRRRAPDKYIFSREVRTEVDEEQIRQVYSTKSHKYGEEREHTTESNKQTTHLDRQQTADSDSSRQQQIQM